MAIAVRLIPGAGKALGYSVPENLAARIDLGMLVRVPVGRRSVLGVVTGLEPPGDFPRDRLKAIQTVEYAFPVLTGELIRLAVWIAEYYAVEVEAALEAMIPAAIRKGHRFRHDVFLEKGRDPVPGEIEGLQRKAPKQAALLEFIRDQFKPVSRSTVLKRLKIPLTSAHSLVEKGLLAETSERVMRDPYAEDLGEGDLVEVREHELNDEQSTAVETVGRLLSDRAFAAHLLQGVTGSGKTEVYLRLLRQVLADGGGAIVLVPEVALTPQTVSRLRARLESAGAGRVVVFHSALSDGERLDAWHALATGEARVCVGPRSAVFSPIPDLRLIVVDEEHEPAYKQEETPRYHGRDVAVVRAQLNDAVCLLGSATPSLESVRNAEAGKYGLSRLTRRVDDRALPMVHVVDMKREVLARHGSVQISQFLAEKLRDRLEKQEQVILFINRRGYNTSMVCPDCGFVAQCEHCSVPMVYHRVEEVLRCHLCDAARDAWFHCPQCHTRNIRWRGFGTQKVEEVVAKIAPQARVVRVDTDALRKKNVFRKILGDFRRGKIDVLVGTQMLAKGLDFPNVTLVGLVDADLSLHLHDLRARERTFQLIVQVSGRAGRGDRAGEVVVQSFLPHDPAIQFARQGDVDGFVEMELEMRREFQYPPFRHLINHLFRGRSEEKVRFFAEQWVKRLEGSGPLAEILEILGPEPAPVEKIKDHYRYRAWYLTRRIRPAVAGLRALRKDFPMDPDVIDVLDVDAMNLM